MKPKKRLPTNERDVPYQSLVKSILAEQVEEALHSTKT